MTTAERQALDLLRASYRAKVEAFAKRLRPRFESGELSDYNAQYVAGNTPASVKRMEAACRRSALVRGEWARLAVALSDYGPRAAQESAGVEGAAWVALVTNVLEIAKRRRWIRRSREGVNS